MPIPSLPNHSPVRNNSIDSDFSAGDNLKILINRIMDPINRMFSEVNTIIIAFDCLKREITHLLLNL